MPLPVQDQPLVVPEQLVLLLGLVNLFLVSQQLFFSFFITDPALNFFEKFVNFIGCNLRLVNHEGSLLSEGSEARNDFFCSGILARLIIQAQSFPILRLYRLRDWHVEMRGRFTSATDDIIDGDIDAFGVFAHWPSLGLFAVSVRTCCSFFLHISLLYILFV